MHYRLLGLLPPICLGVLGISPSLQGFSFTPYFDIIGPFAPYCENYQFSGYYIANSNGLKIRERLVAGEDIRNPVYTETKRSHDAFKGDRVDLTFTIPFRNILGYSGINCKFMVIDESDAVLNSFSFRIKPYSAARINPKNYLQSYYTIDDVVVNPVHYEYNHTERFKFDRFIDYFNTDTYYRIDLNNISLYYECIKAFPGCQASLHFVDYQRLFPYLDNDDLIPSFDIPLQWVDTYNRISFKYANQMYVDPKTLQMSFEAKPRMKLTKYFYLPINKTEQLLNQVFTLKVSKFGYNQTNFDWDIRYINDRKLVGDCDNSDFCVKGEIVNG